MQRRRYLQLMMLPLFLSACGDERDSTEPLLRLGEVLGGDDTQGYLRAETPRTFDFPTDHGPHHGFRNEWWYFTGNLEDAAGRRFGYQLTFFNGATRPPGAEGAQSPWDSERAWMAHLALTDVAAGEHRVVERFSRESPALAGANTDEIWLEDWRIEIGKGTEPWRLRAFDQDSGLGLEFELRPLKPPVLQGREGLSQKSAEPGNASYYYSLTRIATAGRLRIGGEDHAVSGLSWLDREWSTSALAEDQTGWNWFSLQFDDGQELMYYELIDQNGAPHPYSAGNWTDTAARQTYVTPDEVNLVPLSTWTSPNGTDYVTSWELGYAGRRWRVEALLEDQWMDTSLPYWEGAVIVREADSGTPVGRGYLEQVRP